MPLLRNALAWGLALAAFMLLFQALMSGLELSRVRHHFDEYWGDLSWQQYRVTFRPVSPGQQPGPKKSMPVLRYGFNLAHHAALRAEVLQTDIPLAEAGPLLYDTLRYPHGFSPDSVYAAWVGLRGHYLSFAFGAKPAAVLTSYRAVAAPAAAPRYPPLANWRAPLLLYSWASLTLVLWFAAAFVGLVLLADARDTASRVAALALVLLFTATRGYVDWLDYHTGQEVPIIGPLLSLLLLGLYGYLVSRPAKAAPAVG